MRDGDGLVAGRDSDRLAEDVIDTYAEFQTLLHGKGRFPGDHFRAFFDAVVHYVEATKGDVMIHRDVGSAVSGLREILELQSLRAPDWAIYAAERLDCMLFSGYDPYFEGDEPPGL